MKVFKVLWGYYLFISMSAVGLMGVGQLSLGYFDLDQLLFAGLSTFLVYNFIHWMQSEIRLDYRLILIVVASVLLFFTISAFSLIQLSFLLVSGLFSLLYELGPNMKYKGLRYWRYFKVFHISISWFILCFLVPGLQGDSDDSVQVKLFLLFGFCWCFLWAFAFDIRDRKSDKGTLYTLANSSSVYGQIFSLLMLFAVASLALWFSGAYSLWSAVVLIVVFSSCLGSYRINNFWFYMAFLDGLPLIWFGLLYFSIL